MNQTTSSKSELLKKYSALQQYFAAHLAEGICLAYSGGVDSTLLLKVAADLTADTSQNGNAQNSRPVLAVILETQLHPHSDTAYACEMAKKLQALPQVLPIDEFDDPQILQNPVNRCYLCKRLLFSSLKKLAVSKNYQFLCDGTNKDDEKEYRPGRQALKELGIHSPLLELGITKAEVRELSKMLLLSTATRPSTPCLATRLPYHTPLDRDLLARLHKGEVLLREKGFYNVRLRYHAPILRLELDCESFPLLLSQRTEIVAAMKALGFSYITLDLEGFRSGSMDLNLRS